jgi:hypothetical protein
MVIASGPPDAVTVTFAVEVAEPEALVAVSVYVVVAVGLTLVEPLAWVDVNVPGVMATLVAPLVAQLSVLLAPEVTLVGLAVNELIVGLLAEFTVTVSVDVVEPAVLVAVSVYVVVAVGLTLVEPLAWVDVNVPGVMATLVAPLVTQLSVLLAPAFRLVGFAVKEVIAGTEPFPEDWFDENVEPQPASPAQASRMSTAAQKSGSKERSPRNLRLFLPNEIAEAMRSPFVAVDCIILAKTANRPLSRSPCATLTGRVNPNSGTLVPKALEAGNHLPLEESCRRIFWNSCAPTPWSLPTPGTSRR